MNATSRSSVGAVAIGKNEGERLRICLQSLAKQVSRLVYVDSGSSDGSVELARSVEAVVVELDPRIPFTAARARNAGVERLTEIAPGHQVACHFALQPGETLLERTVQLGRKVDIAGD